TVSRWVSATPAGVTNPCALFPSADSTTPLPENACSLSNAAGFEAPTYTVSFDYRVSNDVMAYLAHRRGYRSGGISARGSSPEALRPFEPEIVHDYEVGLKSEFALGDNPTRLNVAAYHQDYRDIQRNDTAPDSRGFFIAVITNAAEATVRGFEADFETLIGDHWQLNARYAYTDTGYDAWTTQAGLDRSRNRFVAVPDHALNGAARWSSGLAHIGGDLALEGGFSYQSDVATSVDNTVDTTGRSCPGTTQKGYTLFNARAEWSNAFGRQGLSMALWGKNLTNEAYSVVSVCVYNTAFGSTFSFFGEPRTAGLDVRLRF
ncbi:MAG TPA: TonB-dependent receptor, partial [Terriglobales bacterium]|nr:TonB-dependent receptor [Terriglobales bacterium]